ncbi:MAG TPA: addiction module toxin RelE [Leclercia adecarboxylata]|nr:addiction module toxin RelE [Leclercia sp. LSNIH3]POW70362.1 addiction module toxin RelE [Leclercia sp. LSNIH4]RFS78784.1 addiction module toxin RelE [Leclercia adecarboxylata]HAF53575.1 addiction module toxin RelE [Leclercia adecarboxylata]HBQ66000.1 addiction module toxin RelE [Leclercia adecarboxylata]
MTGRLRHASFGVHQDGKSVKPRTLTPVSGWGKQTPPTQKQPEG